jgi:pyrophosphatase PpaX
VQNRIKAILFDFDGTLVFLSTNYQIIRNRLTELFLKYGFISTFHPIVESIYRGISILKENKISEPAVEAVKDQAFNIIREEEVKAVESAVLMNKAEETMKSLRNHNIPFAIVSNNGRDCIQSCLNKFKLPHPDVIVAREDTGKLKPHPQHFKIALNKLNVDVDEAIVVGDSYNDIVGGTQIGIVSVLIHMDNMAKTTDSLRPDFRVSSLIEILPMVSLSK